MWPWCLAMMSRATRPEDVRQVVIDITVQPKNVMFPHRCQAYPSPQKLVKLAGKLGLDLRQ